MENKSPTPQGMGLGLFGGDAVDHHGNRLVRVLDV
jgi:hypothetical protein